MSFQICDIECYRNYFLLLILEPETGTVYRWEKHNEIERGRTHSELRSMLKGNTTVTFNGLGYDFYLVSAYLDLRTNEQLKEVSDFMINTPMAQWSVTKELGVEKYPSPHLDLMPVAPLVASLKIYAGRLHAPRLQDLPVHHDAMISERYRDVLVEYCINDLNATLVLFRFLMPQLKLRHQMGKRYQMRLTSMSDAQIAEAVIKHLLADKKVIAKRPIMVPTLFTYKLPYCVQLRDPVLKRAMHAATYADYKMGASGRLLCPKEIKPIIEFEGRKYQMGMGGLHSTEKNQCIQIKPGEYLTDLDVTSYYPRLILNNRLYPEHLGPAFLEVYESLVSNRVSAKGKGDHVAADALKIVINSSFGKFGSKYSALYAPKLLLQTTMSGQLYLLMLIEMIEKRTGCSVVSANTDGITVHSPNGKEYAKMLSVACNWEMRTDMTLENVEYRALFAQDVNNYVAVKTDGGLKGKGIFAGESLSKNPNFPIVQRAAIELFSNGVAVEDTIGECRDIRQFVCLRKVGGGAIYRDDEVGSTVRWYLSTQGSPILYRKDAKRVPFGDHARLINNLPERFPNDIDFEAYESKANELVSNITQSDIHA